MKSDKFNYDIFQLRLEISFIDREILKLIEKRNAIAKDIGKVKSDANIPVRDIQREASSLEVLKASTCLSGEVVAKIHEILVKLAIDSQK